MWNMLFCPRREMPSMPCVWDILDTPPEDALGQARPRACESLLALTPPKVGLEGPGPHLHGQARPPLETRQAPGWRFAEGVRRSLAARAQCRLAQDGPSAPLCRKTHERTGVRPYSLGASICENANCALSSVRGFDGCFGPVARAQIGPKQKEHCLRANTARLGAVARLAILIVAMRPWPKPSWVHIEWPCKLISLAVCVS